MLNINNKNLVFLIESYRKFSLEYFITILTLFIIMNLQIINELSFLFKLEINSNDTSTIRLFFEILDIICLKFLLNGNYKFVFISFIMLLFIIFVIILIYIINKKLSFMRVNLNWILLIILFITQIIFNIPLNNLALDFIFGFKTFNNISIILLVFICIIHVLLILQKILFLYFITNNFFKNTRKRFFEYNYNLYFYITIIMYVSPILNKIHTNYDNMFTLIILLALYIYSVFIFINYNKFYYYFNITVNKFVFFFITSSNLVLFFNIFIILFKINNIISLFIWIVILLLYLLLLSLNLKNKLILVKSKNIWKNIIYSYINKPIDELFNFKIFRFHNFNCLNISCICHKIKIKLENNKIKEIKKINILKILKINLESLKINSTNKRILLEIFLFKNVKYFLYKYICLTIKFKSLQKNNSIKSYLIERLLNKYIKKLSVSENIYNISFEELINFHRNFEKFKLFILKFNKNFNRKILDFDILNRNIEDLKQNIISINNDINHINKLYIILQNNKNSNVIKLIYTKFWLVYLNDKNKSIKIIKKIEKGLWLNNFNNNVLENLKINFFVISSIEKDFSIKFLEYSENFGTELGYDLEELKTLTLEHILLLSISNIHDGYIKRFLKDSSFSKNNIKKVFMITKNRFIKCYNMEFKIIPEIKNKLKIIGVFKRIIDLKYFIVYDLLSENVFYINKQIYTDFKLTMKNKNYYLTIPHSIWAKDYFKAFKELNKENLNKKILLKNVLNKEEIKINVTNIKTILNEEFQVIFLGFNVNIDKLDRKALNIKKENKIMINNANKIERNNISESINMENHIIKKELLFFASNKFKNILIFIISVFILIMFSFIAYFRLIYYFQFILSNRIEYLITFETNTYLYYKYIYETNILYSNLDNQVIIKDIKKKYNDLSIIFYQNNKKYIKSINNINFYNKQLTNNNISIKKVQIYVLNNNKIETKDIIPVNNLFNTISKGEILKNSRWLSNNLKEIIYISLNFHSNYKDVRRLRKILVRKEALNVNLEYYIILSTFIFNYIWVLLCSIIYLIYYKKWEIRLNDKICYYFSKLKLNFMNKNELFNNKNELEFNFEFKNIKYIANLYNNESNKPNLNKNISKNQIYKNENKIFKAIILKIVLLIILILWLLFSILIFNDIIYSYIKINIDHYESIYNIRNILSKYLIFYINSSNIYKNLGSENYDKLMKDNYDLMYLDITKISNLNNIKFILYSDFKNIENKFFNINSCFDELNKITNCKINELYNKEAFLLLVLVYENLKNNLGNFDIKIILENMKIINYLDKGLEILENKFEILSKKLLSFNLYIHIILLILYEISIILYLYFLVSSLIIFNKNKKIFENYFLNFN